MRAEPAAPGVDVHLFRYVESEKALVPLPYRPGRGVHGEPRLVVERSRASQLAVGDIVARVGETRVRTRTELVRALDDVSPGAAIALNILRDGAEIDVSRKPVARESDAAGDEKPRIVDLFDDLGVAFAGYPLDLGEQSRIGECSPRGIAFELELGSYLIVLRRDGEPDVRFPISVPQGDDGDIVVELPERTPSDEGRERWPIILMSWFTAAEYVAWKNRHDTEGFVYALPNDVQWLAAARGADQRAYVWGDYLVWSYAWCFLGRDDGLPGDVGRSPLDESVYGVRDMKGSAREILADRLGPPNMASVRGGSWNSVFEGNISSESGTTEDTEDTEQKKRESTDEVPRFPLGFPPRSCVQR